MALGTSILLIAVGAIMYFAVNVDTEGFNLNTVGLILMVVGVLGLLISMVMGAAWSRRGDGVITRDREVL